MNRDELETLAARCDEQNDFAAFDAAVAAELSAATDTEAVWALLGIHGMSGLSFGEGQLPTVAVDALVTRALSEGSAEWLGIAARMASYEPAAVLDDQDWKPVVRRDLAAHADALRAAWTQASEPLRAQIAHLLVIAEIATAEDGTRLEALADETRDPEVLGLTLALLARVAEPEVARGRLASALEHTDLAVRLMASAAMVGRAIALDERALQPLVDALAVDGEGIDVAPALPRWWAFRTHEQPEPASALAKRSLNLATLEDPTQAIAALAARGDSGWREAETLQALAWPEGTPAMGLVAAELSLAQRVALTALARPPLSGEPGALHPFGLPSPDDLPDFLAEEGPRWSVREVTRPDGTRARWPLARIWKSRIADELTHAEALRALTEPLAAADLWSLMTTEWRGILNQWTGKSREVAYLERDAELVVSCLERMNAAGFDLGAALRARLESPLINARHALTIALLVALKQPKFRANERIWAEVSDGVDAYAHESPVLVRLFGELAEPVKDAIRELLPPPRRDRARPEL